MGISSAGSVHGLLGVCGVLEEWGAHVRVLMGVCKAMLQATLKPVVSGPFPMV